MEDGRRGFEGGLRPSIASQTRPRERMRQRRSPLSRRPSWHTESGSSGARFETRATGRSGRRPLDSFCAELIQTGFELMALREETDHLAHQTGGLDGRPPVFRARKASETRCEP
jgi:hypothetical protein